MKALSLGKKRHHAAHVGPEELSGLLLRNVQHFYTYLHGRFGAQRYGHDSNYLAVPSAIGISVANNLARLAQLDLADFALLNFQITFEFREVSHLAEAGRDVE